MRVAVTIYPLLLALGACRGAESPAAAAIQGGRAERVEGGVRVTNGGDRPISFVVVNRGWLGLLVPCTDPNASCVRLNAGQSTTVPDGQIVGLTPDANEAAVWYWHDTDESGNGKELVVPL